ncbi:MAG: hypothetical protein VX496_00730, partial [Planctomycetota bacterium]|nr:hypothetical protein [Planctomycetota bacterium]
DSSSAGFSFSAALRASSSSAVSDEDMALTEPSSSSLSSARRGPRFFRRRSIPAAQLMTSSMSRPSLSALRPGIAVGLELAASAPRSLQSWAATRRV